MKSRGSRRWVLPSLLSVAFVAVVCIAALPPASGEAGSPASIPVSAPEAPAAAEQPAAALVADAPAEAEGEPFGGLEYEPGVVLVTLPAGVSPSEAVAAIADETGLAGVALANAADADAPAATAAENPRLVELSVPGDMPLEDAIAQVSASSAVETVQPNFVYHLADVVDPEQAARDSLVAQNFIAQGLVTQAAETDPRIGDQWMLPSIYAYGDSTDVGNAWDVVTADNAVTVAVIDEGFQADHVDLKGNVVDTYNSATEKSGVAAVAEVSTEKGHGTHVAGIVSATAFNGEGVAGVSHNANLMLIKAYDASANGFPTASLVRAFEHARSQRNTDLNVRVISMSIGGKVEDSYQWEDDLLIKQIDSATSEGIVVVCSAGNQDTSEKRNWIVPYIDYPADYRNVVSVMNLQKTGTNVHNVSRSSDSNYNKTDPIGTVLSGKDICAPGTGIVSTMPGDAYGTKNGTSMATPCVSGVLALVFAKQPNLSATDAVSLLYSTVTDLGAAGWDAGTGYGEVNAYRAVTETDAYLSGVTSVQVGKSVKFSAGGPTLAWGSEDPTIAQVNGSGVVTGVKGGTTRIYALVSYFFFTSRAYATVTVYDPELPSSVSVKAGSSAKVTLSCTPSGTWNWTSSDPAIATASGSGTACTVVGVKPGTATLTATLSGNPDISTSTTVTVQPLNLADATVTFSGATYNGSAQRLKPTVKVGSVTLSESGDYTLSYPGGDYVNAGTKSVTVSAATGGRCTGSKAATYTIGRRSATITAKSASKAYDGTALTASAAGYTTSGFVKSADLSRVTLGGSITNVGSTIASVSSYQLAANMAQNYSVATRGGTLTVTAASLTSAAVTLSPASYTYDGKAKTPATTVRLGSRTLAAGTDYTVSYSNNTAVGTATATVTGKGNYTGTARATFGISKGVLETYAGANRYETAQKLASASAAATSSVKGIIVCSCNDGRFPDALSAAGLSGVLGYPVVTVNGEGLTAADKRALSAMQAKSPSKSLDILIAGSTAAVSASVESSLRAYGSVSTRFAGADRYETNRLIYEYGTKHGGWSSSYVFLSRGDAFPDALTIAPFLVWRKCPIVLVSPSASSLTSAQRTMVSGASQVVALGSTASVSAALLSDAKRFGRGGSTTRLGGSDRYATSALIVQWELECGMKLEGAGFATGQKFPDALASSWLLGSRGSVLGVVSPSGGNQAMTSAIRSGTSGGAPSTLRMFGDTASVPASVRAQIASAANWPSYTTTSK